MFAGEVMALRRFLPDRSKTGLIVTLAALALLLCVALPSLTSRAYLQGRRNGIRERVRERLRNARQGERGTSARSIKVGNVTRSYLLHVPPPYDNTKPAPLVLVFHGGESTPQQMERYTGLSDVADREGFIVVYPEGINRHWNDGREGAPKVDDVGFVYALIEHLGRSLKIDRRRIYATGISNGGMFTQRLACELSGTIAAVASVAATMPEAMSARCRPSSPISVLLMHGTDDPLVPYKGGAMPRTTLGGSVLSAHDTIRYWAEHNRCPQKPSITDLPDKDPQDGTRVRLEAYAKCAGGAEARLYAVEGGGHTLPGGRPYLPERLIGRTSRDIDGSETIWGFFEKLPAR